MSKIEFMRELEGLLGNISATEREEALQYYNDYFEEAGIENEQQVIQELGSPARVAANIRKELFGTGAGYEVNRNTPATKEDCAFADAAYSSSTDIQPKRVADKTGFPGWAIVLIVILAVLASPLLLGILGTLFGCVVAWFALIFAVGAVAISMLLVLVLLLVVGIGCLFVSPWVGIAVIGAGLLCGAVGVVALMLTVLMAGVITPAVFRGIGHLFHRKKVAEVA